MLILANFNDYVGGGEVIALDFARYLRKTDTPYILFCAEDSHIHMTAVSEGLQFLSVHKENQSLYYSSKQSAEELAQKLMNLNSSLLRIVSFTFRDLYNYFLYRRYLNQAHTISHYVLHPEDYKYSASGRVLKRNKVIRNNLRILSELSQLNGLILPNPNAARQLININYSNSYVPFYLNKYPAKKSDLATKNANKILKVLIVSRFVSFKISTIVELLRLVKRVDNLRLEVVGYGRWSFLVKFWASLCSSRVTILGAQTKENLGSIIERNDVLVAQGTTILLGVEWSKPVLIAPYTKWYDWIFSRAGTVGWYGTKSLMDYGAYRLDNFSSSRHAFQNWLTIESIAEFNELQKRIDFSEITEEKVFDSLKKAIELSIATGRNTNLEMARPQIIKRIFHIFRKW